jgi:CheY-like chemotaxis protein
VVEARDGREALELAASTAPDLIFLDLLMPDMSGFDVMRQLKLGADTSPIPIVVHSSLTLDGPEHAQVVRDAAAILTKDPRSYSADVSQVRRILRDYGFAPALQSTVNG